MAYTRAELQLQVSALFDDPEPRSITPAQLKTLFNNIIEAAFLAEDDYTYPSSVASLEVQTEIKVDGTKVIGAQQTGISPPPSEDPTVGDVATAARSIITALESHGLIAPIA